MEKLLTTIEESKKLLELGIDKKTAKTWWCQSDGKRIPAWSLGALIKVYLMLDNNARITFDNRDAGNDLIASMVYAIEHCLKEKTSS